MADPLICLYRADWTGWSFSAEVVTRQNTQVAQLLADRAFADFRRYTSGVLLALAPRPNPADPGAVTPPVGQQWSSSRDQILIAPGGQYRYEPCADAGGLADLDDLADDELVTAVLSDGEYCWVIRSGEADRSQADPALTPVDHIVRPDWLMSRLQLTLTGTTELAGRSMLMVRGTPRPRPNQWALGIALLDWVDFLVDVELGLVRRRQAIFQGQPLSVFEVRDFTLEPPAGGDPANFRPDDSVEVDDCGRDSTSLLWRGADWAAAGNEVAGTSVAVSVTRGALYLAARGVSRPEPPRTAPAGAETAMPTPDPAESASVATESVSDGTLRLIARAGQPPLSLSAEVHHWIDARRARFSRSDLTVGLDQHDLPAGTNFLGTESGLFSQLRNAPRIASLRVAMPDRYRIDYQFDQGSRQPRTIACDGQRLRKVYHNRVIASPAQSLPTDFVRLLDPAWLLADWQLTEGGQETVSGRVAVRVQAVPPPHPDPIGRSDPPTAIRIDLLIDAELGIVLRQTSYAADEPVARIELRDLAIVPEVDPLELGSAIAPELPVISTNGEPVDDFDLPSVAKSIRDVSSGLAALFRRPR
jgi:hypothetical protein